VHRAKPDSKTVVDTNALYIRGPYRRIPCYSISRPEETIGNRERRVYPSPHILVTIFGPRRGTRLATIVNSGSTINMISRKLCDIIGLEIVDASEYDMRPVKGLMSDLDGVVDNVTITIGAISFDISFFVISGPNHYCLLRQLFVMQSGIKLSGTPDKIDRPEFAELFDLKRRKIIRMLCARLLRRKVTPTRELLGKSLEMDSESSSEEN
jgi:hypothetical protein